MAYNSGALLQHINHRIFVCGVGIYWVVAKLFSGRFGLFGGSLRVPNFAWNVIAINVGLLEKHV